MNILACIVVGILAGWLAERITGRNHGLLTNLIVGIVGAFIGGFLISSLLGFHYAEGFNVLPSWWQLWAPSSCWRSLAAFRNGLLCESPCGPGTGSPIEARRV